VASSFRVYVDESGDEGFTFHATGEGSSRWFVLSAVVVRHENDLQLVQAVKAARVALGKKEKEALHFVKLDHHKRLAWSQAVAKCPIRSVSILIHKPSLANPELYKANSYHLYRYASRLLMERVSWFCREMYDPAKGDGFAEIVFSNRRRMSYADIQEYWRRLQSGPDAAAVKIEWAHLDPNRISAVNHDQLAGLQIADCVASAHYSAVTLDRYGNAEPRYCQAMSRVLYRYSKRAFGYGLKFWPSLEKLRPSMPHLAAFDGL
jgi:hypothetical protein